MKQFVYAVIIAFSISLTSGCKNKSATFSNADGKFLFSSNGTYTQTFLSFPPRSSKEDKSNISDVLTNTGTWSLIAPSDSSSNGNFKVKLSGVHSRSHKSLADNYIVTVDTQNIRNFDKLLASKMPILPKESPNNSPDWLTEFDI